MKLVYSIIAIVALCSSLRLVSADSTYWDPQSCRVMLKPGEICTKDMKLHCPLSCGICTDSCKDSTPEICALLITKGADCRGKHFKAQCASSCRNCVENPYA